MKLATTAIAAASAALFAGAAVANEAEGVKFTDIDTNADGYLTLAEIQAVKPDVTLEKMAAYDEDGDQLLSEAEFETWIEASKQSAGDRRGS